MDRYLDPKSDLAFKNVFGTDKNKGILLAFLNDIFEGVHDKIVDVTFIPPHQDTGIRVLRQSIVDVQCTDTKDKTFIIEMQCAKEGHFIKRAVAYASRAYINQRKKPNDYENMNDVVFLAILDHSLFPNKNEYLSHHRVCDLLTHEIDIPQLSFTFLELGKFNKKFEELKTSIEKWAYFFKEEASPEEIADIRSSDQIMGEAYTALAEFNYTEEQLLEYEKYGMKEDEINTRITEGKAEGEAKGKAAGLAEGEAKKARETAVNALGMGLSVEQISKLTGLSQEEITGLKQ
jgi:predicted transposase/invertase (TIGR01784 family)